MASSSSAANDGPGGPLRFFSGESEDTREYKRWKTWVQNKLLTLDKLPKTAKGAYIYTLLSGKALECVEHLEPEQYQKEDGDRVLWELLDQRFPQKDKTDELGETLGKIFVLKSNEGESLKSWIARATEAFDNCERRASVKFPDEARGWILLHRANLTEDQQAVVLARARGSLKRSDIAVALRSCFPDLVLRTKKANPVHLVDDPTMPHSDNDDEVDNEIDDFDDVEALLGEHLTDSTSVTGEFFTETEAAEVLATTWKEKRQELNKLQKTRRFTAAKDSKRSFRIEVEELKRKTKCHKCGQLGHWSRECRSKTDLRTTKNKGAAGSTATSGTSGAAYVQSAHEFVASVVPTKTLLQRAREMFRAQAQSQVPLQETQEVMLVSSPGFGVIDSGCGRTIIGASTLAAFQQLWSKRGIEMPPLTQEVNHFKYGNGETETTDKVVQIPVFLAGRKGTISAAIVKGRAPLLISRAALQALRATIDFADQRIRLFEDQREIPLKTNSAGQFVLPLLEEPVKSEPITKFQEVLAFAPETPNEESETQDDHSDVQDAEAPEESERLQEDNDVSDSSSGVSPKPKRWIREDWGLTHTPISSGMGPNWQHVSHRIVRCADSHQVLFNEPIDPGRRKSRYHHEIPKHVRHTITEFRHHDPRELQAAPPTVLSDHQCRQLQKQIHQCNHSIGIEQAAVGHRKSKILVVEVFSPPRFKTVCEEVGLKARSIDLITGQDLTKKQTRDELEQSIRENPPDLLVLCPPCTDEGGWFHLNSTKWDQLVYNQRVARSRSFIRFCMKLFRLQTDRGKQALFEHPTGAKTWSYPEVQSLCRKFHVVKCHMCQYGLKLPESKNFIRKSTKLLVSHEEMKVLGKLCPGKKDPQHVCHDTVAGSSSTVGRISVFAGQYTTEFVRAVLQTVPSYAQATRPEQEVLEVIEDQVSNQGWNEVLAARNVLKESRSDEELIPILHRLHKNLGHPTNSDLIRILKHGQASEQALKLARELSCQFCQSHSRPHAALPAHPSHITEFNQQLGLDVKHLPGWKVGQKVCALNLVDTASSYQRVIPFFESETSRVLWSILKDHWIAWAGPPKEVILDPKATNLGEPLVVPLEQFGVHIRPIAAEAHYQLGKTESHGGWFERVLQKIIDEHSPQTKDEWLECVLQAHVKNTMIQNHGVTPHQFIFGRNPSVPSDLLDEPLSVVAATASTTDAALAKAEAIRTSARQAVLQLQDNRALRVALLARPRVAIHYNPGSLVAYWRCQKWVQGKLVQGGKWYGTAVVLGNIGRNLVIAHRKQILRVAPEQVRPATTEEKQLLSSPGAELLGIKDLIEGGAFKSQQYVDLTTQAYPQEPASPAEPTTATAREEHRPEPTTESTSSQLPPLSDSPEPQAPAVPEPLSTPAATGEADASPPAGAAGSAAQSTEPRVSAGADRNLPESEPSSYGPLRRVRGKGAPESLWRPSSTKADDYLEIMKEVVPSMIKELVSPNQDEKSDETMSSNKRALESTSSSSSPENSKSSRLRTASPEHDEALTSEIHASHECMFTEMVESPSTDHQVLIAEYLKKKMNKELHHSNNPEPLQRMVEEGKRQEWQTLLSKGNAVKVHYGKAAEKIKASQAHRFIGSRFVLTREALEEGGNVDPNDYRTFSVKGRWCLQGHLDPDLEHKASTGQLQSPTLNQMSRMLIMQMIASHGWDLQLGDIKGAFLESGAIQEQYRPLYAHMPPGNIPGVDPQAVIEVIGNLYGQNNAPSEWFATFDQAAQELNWKPSKFDACLYTLRDAQNKLIGILGIHVDDTCLGGAGPLFEESVRKLRQRFPFRKWRINGGEFCGCMYSQNVQTKAITLSMKQFSENLRPANIPKGASPDQPLSPFQIKQLRGINGSLNWLASQGRPDLASQTSLSQQAFPNPKIRHLRNANNVIRRAKMFRDLTIRFEPIHPQNLTVVCHSDAAFANVGTHTQAGYVIACTEKKLQDGEAASWCPVTWRSYKLPRAVGSTLAAESQAFASASGTTEWLLLLLHEILEGPMSMRQCREALRERPPILATDCKSLFDHLVSPSAPTAIEDRRTSIDVVIIRESCRLMQAHVRWVPTSHMIADALTKDQGDPTDMLRSCIRRATYQISPESDVLQQQAKEREDRLSRRLTKAENS